MASWLCCQHSWILVQFTVMQTVCLMYNVDFSHPVSAPLSATLMTSLSATSMTRAVSIADTLLTIEFTAASISSHHLVMGESCRGVLRVLSVLLTVFFMPSFHNYLNLTLFLSVSCLTSLKPLDVQFMKAIHNKVNVVPVIAKADTLTLRERERLKRRVRAVVIHCSESLIDIMFSWSL